MGQTEQSRRSAARSDASNAASTSEIPDAVRVDGRDTRWTQHRAERRRELTEAALRAIRKHGATVGMDEIAAEAGTSKTVIYRHMGDRLGLYLAVCESVDDRILTDLHKSLTDVDAAHAAAHELTSGHTREMTVAVIDSYLRQVERDPEVYRFVVRRPQLNIPPEQDPVIGLSDTIAGVLEPIFAAALTIAGKDVEPARLWAHGLIGFVRESADRWLADPDRAPRASVVAHLADFAAVGLTGVLSNSTEESK
ncbi:TetR/AcrR family transcriptional regulator [Rudaeicoccus suwonensis]|uniref:TetR family transcriptional regulator n=1 Tax=Rudaeicoccus suwonensis TaxID=657409 RepID=A0A561E7K4_9MICO|nr:TetR family transcriptional regulator [Rudaeicoccus suwonensis]TWE11598.1 TetR family transcriptional regulator [Rudaeicoccus suwonensis]